MHQQPGRSQRPQARPRATARRLGADARRKEAETRRAAVRRRALVSAWLHALTPRERGR